MRSESDQQDRSALQENKSHDPQHQRFTGKAQPIGAVHHLEQASELVSIANLICDGSPRSAGEDEEHICRLAGLDEPLPPILVHRATMRVIDGFHRVAAAIRRNRTEITVRYLDGSLDAAFVTGVEANVTHGLPLSLVDRRLAAQRILCTHPERSDRSIAESTGLSAKTIATLRCATAENTQLHGRVGRDGRVRPLTTAAGRRRAAEIIAARPEASLREIAEQAGISPGTVRDVRARLRRGEDPVAQRPPRAGQTATSAGQPQSSSIPTVGLAEAADVNPLLMTLSRDPALRMNEVGRDLLRWFHTHAVNSVDGVRIVESAPEHCLSQLIELANRCSANWAKIAQELAISSESKLSKCEPLGIAKDEQCS